MSGSAQDRARAAFARQFGAQPDGVVFAPGRVNLIGDHVDYSGGLVLPIPLALGTAVAWRATSRPGIRAVAADQADEYDDFLPGEAPGSAHGWRTYVRGMAAVMHSQNGAGAELAIAGDLPRGAGLSSSASLCIALGLAMVASGLAATCPPASMARAAQRTEHEFAGVACGMMDQMASACGLPGHAMLLDCRDLSWRNLALPQGWAVLVCQSGVTRGLASGEYNLRRAQCESAAQRLGVATLRNVLPEQLAAATLTADEHKRAAHVVGEIARVCAAAECMERGDLPNFGQYLNDSHASLRDLFEVSHPEVDRLVAILQQAIGSQGGARMTGGGFGGAVVAVVRAGEVARLRAEIRAYAPNIAGQMLELAGGDAGTSELAELGFK